MSKFKAGYHNIKRKVIACATVIEEMVPLLPEDISYEVLDFGLHLNPSELKSLLQKKIDEVGKDVDVVLLGYGLCSMAVIGLKASSAALVIPRTDDCIAIFLGSSEEYKKQAQLEPGTYYLTKGWISAGDTPFDEHKKLVERYGKEKAERMSKMVLKNYKRLAFINTGEYELERCHAYSKRLARKFDLYYEEIEGNPTLINKMINGPWDEDFVVVRPGQTLTYNRFMNPSPDGSQRYRQQN
jgi:hypothetical protein